MPDRLQEIRARLDALPSTTSWTYDDEAACVRSKNGSVIADVPFYDEGIFIAHAPGDIAWLLRRLENERADSALHEDDIHDLRDQVNALWDIVAEQDVPNVLDVYAERLEAQRVMRRGRIAAHGDPMTNYWGGWRAGNVTIEEASDA